MAEGQLRLTNAQLVAFGFTRRVGTKAADDPLTAALRDSRALRWPASSPKAMIDTSSKPCGRRCARTST